MPPQIDKDLAKKIAKKLKATMVKGGAHDIATVYHDGVIVASCGIRHGSSKSLGHDYMPDEIHVNMHQAKLLGRCPTSREQWVECLRSKGIIRRPDGGGLGEEE